MCTGASLIYASEEELQLLGVIKHRDRQPPSLLSFVMSALVCADLFILIAHLNP